MRPEEIDYSDTRKHYFDLASGEVLAGDEERDRYIAAGAQAVRVVDLGPLLRDPQPHMDLDSAEYPRLDTSEWQPEQYQAFTRWLSKVVEPPARPEEKVITRQIFHHARKLGIGPGVYAINREFGGHSKLYAAAGVAEAHLVKVQEDLTIEDAVAYVRKLGGRDYRPTTEDLRRAHRKDPSNPTVILLWARFRHIGGYNKVMELAGYPVIKLWGREDFIDYGVRFMRANDGQLLTARMANYLSKKQKGPTASTIINHFDHLSTYQTELIRRFYEQRELKKAHDETQLAKIKEDLRAETVPLELFSPFSMQDPTEEAEVMADRQKAQELYHQRDIRVILEQLGVNETIKRYAKFKVLEELTPSMGPARKIAISRGLTSRSFTAAIRKTFSIPPGDIESAALLQGFFEYIWPDDDAIEPLRLDDGYRAYASDLEAKDRARRRNKQAQKTVAVTPR